MRKDAKLYLKYYTVNEEDKPLCDFSKEELTAHIIRNYAGDPIGVLNSLYQKMEIGFVLYSTTKTLLEGICYVKE